MRINKKELRGIFKEAYFEVLQEKKSKLSLTNLLSEEGAELRDSTSEMVAKFPTLKTTLINLFTKQYETFIKQIDWISPKPTTFRVVLPSDQDFTLKWMGDGFQAQISGKKYDLSSVHDYQQALDKLGILMKDGEIQKLGDGSDEMPMDGGGAPNTAVGGGGGSPTPLGPDLGAPDESEFEEPEGEDNTPSL